MPAARDSEAIQREYDTKTAASYDALHGEDDPLAQHGLPYLSALIILEKSRLRKTRLIGLGL